jgi:hypothetical protein
VGAYYIYMKARPVQQRDASDSPAPRKPGKSRSSRRRESRSKQQRHDNVLVAATPRSATTSKTAARVSGSGVPASKTASAAATTSVAAAPSAGRTLDDARRRNADATCAKCGKAKSEHELPNRNFFDIKCAECAHIFCGTCAPRTAAAVAGVWRCERCMARPTGTVEQEHDVADSSNNNMEDDDSSTAGSQRLVTAMRGLDNILCSTCGLDAREHLGDAKTARRVTQCAGCCGFFRGDCGPHKKEALLFQQLSEEGKRPPKMGTQKWMCAVCDKQKGKTREELREEARAAREEKKRQQELQRQREEEKKKKQEEEQKKQREAAEAAEAMRRRSNLNHEAAPFVPKTMTKTTIPEETTKTTKTETEKSKTTLPVAVATETTMPKTTAAAKTKTETARTKTTTATTATTMTTTTNKRKAAAPRGAAPAAAAAVPARTAKEPERTADDMQELFGADSRVRPHVESTLLGGLLERVSIEVQKERLKEMKGLTVATRMRHLRALNNFKFEVKQRGWEKLTLADAITLYIDTLAAERKWAATTKHREAANLLGAFGQLPFYTCSRISIFPAREKKVDMAMCGWEREAKQAQPHEQPTATAADIADAVRLAETDKTVQALLMLQWCFAGRQGDVLQAMSDAIKFDEETGRIEMAFRFGKRTARGGDPYTLTSQVPAQWRAQLAAYLRSRPQNERLFDTVAERMLGARATAALRVANSKLNARSIRRGALQAMGARGVPLEQIQQFAGHSRQQTTLRYLGWAARWAAGQNALADAAQALELTSKDSSPSRSRSTTEEQERDGGTPRPASGAV